VSFSGHSPFLSELSRLLSCLCWVLLPRCTDQLLDERKLEAGQDLERRRETVAHRRPVGAHLRRQRSPQYRVLGIEGEEVAMEATRNRPMTSASDPAVSHGHPTPRSLISAASHGSSSRAQRRNLATLQDCVQPLTAHPTRIGSPRGIDAIEVVIEPVDGTGTPKRTNSGNRTGNRRNIGAASHIKLLASFGE
jgi:hypothetical protein